MSETLQDYKTRVDPDMRATLEWQRNLHFTASTPVGYDLDFDADIQWGCMPLEALLMSLAGCMAIDVVSILNKMRCDVTEYRMEIEAQRSPDPPQRLRRVLMHIHIAGNGLAAEKVARAVKLSEDKYCSVRHSLREDIDIAVETHLEPASRGR
jgi:putative redox protein